MAIRFGANFYCNHIGLRPRKGVLLLPYCLASLLRSQHPPLGMRGCGEFIFKNIDPEELKELAGRVMGLT